MTNVSVATGTVSVTVQVRCPAVTVQSGDPGERSSTFGEPPLTVIVAPFVAADTNAGRRPMLCVTRAGTMSFIPSFCVAEAGCDPPPGLPGVKEPPPPPQAARSAAATIVARP